MRSDRQEGGEKDEDEERMTGRREKVCR